MATLSRVSVLTANFTLAKVPCPMVLPTSYFPTLLIPIAHWPASSLIPASILIPALRRGSDLDEDEINKLNKKKKEVGKMQERMREKERERPK